VPGGIVRGKDQLVVGVIGDCCTVSAVLDTHRNRQACCYRDYLPTGRMAGWQEGAEFSGRCVKLDGSTGDCCQLQGRSHRGIVYEMCLAHSGDMYM